MKKEDDDISLIFKNFNPGLSSERLFMARLERNIDTMEIVKKRNEEFCRASRKAVVIAAFAGFITGIVFTMLLPFLGEIAVSFLDMFHTSIPENIEGELSMIASCIAIGIPAILISVNAYRISLPLISKNPNLWFSIVGR